MALTEARSEAFKSMWLLCMKAELVALSKAALVPLTEGWPGASESRQVCFLCEQAGLVALSKEVLASNKAGLVPLQTTRNNNCLKDES